jgi:hypothetical protein
VAEAPASDAQAVTIRITRQKARPAGWIWPKDITTFVRPF